MNLTTGRVFDCLQGNLGDLIIFLNNNLIIDILEYQVYHCRITTALDKRNCRKAPVLNKSHCRITAVLNKRHCCKAAVLNKSHCRITAVLNKNH